MKQKFFKYCKLILAIYFGLSIWIVKFLFPEFNLISVIQIIARILIAIFLFYEFVKNELTIQKQEDRL